jgi:hypothetical protein
MSGLSKRMIAIWFILACSVGTIYGQKGQAAYLNGHEGEIKGETWHYHSPHYKAKTSLLVRSSDKSKYIEWETEAIPAGYDGECANFVWMFGLDVNEDSHTFELSVNGRRLLEFANPPTANNRELVFSGNGATLTLKSTMVDKYGDLMGYAYLRLPAKNLPREEKLRIRVQGESAGSKSWYMTFKFPVRQEVSFKTEPAVLLRDGARYQLLRTDILYLGDKGEAVIAHPGYRRTFDLKTGLNTFYADVPVVDEPKDIQVEATVDRRPLGRNRFTFKPVTPMTVYLLHHSHVDIGYTHAQPEVEAMQRENLDRALDLVEGTEHYPEGSRFKWNVEVVWPTDQYFETAPEKQKHRLIQALKKQRIELGGFYVNALTSLCRPEELMELTGIGRRLAKRYDFPFQSAMFTDIPGMSWGVVPVLAQSGIRYLSIGTNTSHRIGSSKETWGDRPFYWLSPSGKEKILCWVHGEGYSLFHTGLGFKNLRNKLTEAPVFEYLSRLEERGYPYDIASLRYNIGSDNGPVDPRLPDVVKRWNETYETPKLRIATVGELFSHFEERYSHTLPTVSGDFTPYWEDGAASSAKETADNRRAAERLVQAEILSIIRGGKSLPLKLLTEACRTVLLFTEHTWGSWNSISDPRHPLTIRQWNFKQALSRQAARMAETLLFGEEAGDPVDRIEAIDVFNTSSWQRSGLVTLAPDTFGGVNGVRDEAGQPVPSQTLSSGELVFWASNVPALGSARYYPSSRPFVEKPSSLSVDSTRLSNGLLTVELETSGGAIKSLKRRGMDHQWVDRSRYPGLDHYLYVKGRMPDHPQAAQGATIRIKENGPLLVSLEVETRAPGCEKLTREIRLTRGVDRLEIIDTLDKQAVYEPEGVHLAFPFNVPGGEIRIDSAWGHYRVEKGQIPGANRNYFTVQRWLDISNEQNGVIWCSVDAPMVEIGGIAADPVEYGWLDRALPGQTVYSYVMNNYWETNYKAAQAGEARFRYIVRPHDGPFDPVLAERTGIEASQPLLVCPAPKNTTTPQSLFTVQEPGIVVTSVRGAEDEGDLLVRLFNVTDHTITPTIDGRKAPPALSPRETVIIKLKR